MTGFSLLDKISELISFKATNYKVGLIVNFANQKAEIRRIVL